MIDIVVSKLREQFSEQPRLRELIDFVNNGCEVHRQTEIVNNVCSFCENTKSMSVPRLHLELMTETSVTVTGNAEISPTFVISTEKCSIECPGCVGRDSLHWYIGRSKELYVWAVTVGTLRETSEIVRTDLRVCPTELAVARNCPTMAGYTEISPTGQSEIAPTDSGVETVYVQGTKADLEREIQRIKAEGKTGKYGQRGWVYIYLYRYLCEMFKDMTPPVKRSILFRRWGIYDENIHKEAIETNKAETKLNLKALITELREKRSLGNKINNT